jgi:hypothetical protein
MSKRGRSIPAVERHRSLPEDQGRPEHGAPAHLLHVAAGRRRCRRDVTDPRHRSLGSRSAIMQPTGHILGGRTRLGHYEILGSLGADGMGEVYRARDTKLGRDVALKILPAECQRHAERRARFGREARTLASLMFAPRAAVMLHHIDRRFLPAEHRW